MELITLVVLTLLAAGVIGSIVPMVPGSLISLIGIGVYFFGSQSPSIFFLIFALPVAALTLLIDWFAGSIAAKYGGASTKTSIAAGIAGLIGFIFLGGPIGLALAVAGTVFIREYLLHGKEEESLKAAFYTTIGVLGSGLIQALLTGSILAAYLATLVIK